MHPKAGLLHSGRICSDTWYVRPNSSLFPLLCLLGIAVVLGWSGASKESSEPEPSKMEAFRDFVFELSPEPLIHVQGSAADVYQNALGYYFLEFGSGAVEGWYDPDNRLRLRGISDDNRLIAFVREEPEFRNGVQHEPGTTLIDREANKAYWFPAQFEVVQQRNRFNGAALAGNAGRVLVRRLDSPAASTFAVIQLDPRPEVEMTFEVPPRFLSSSRVHVWAVFSPDSNKLAVFDDSEVRIVDLATGIGRWASSGNSALLLGAGGRPPIVTMQAITDGSGFVVTMALGNDASLSYWRSWDWQGRVLAQRDDGFLLQPSPDGSLIAVLEPMSPIQLGLSVLNIWRTSNGEPVFRITGVTGFRGDDVNLWLADNSGFVIGNQEGVQPVLVRRTGEVVGNAGLPSLSDPDLFAHDTYVSNSLGNQVGPGRIEPAGTSDFFPPWGTHANEIRFAAPQLGYDYGITGFITQPHVDTAPYGGPPTLHLAPHSIGMPIHDAPNGDVIGEVTATGPITVLEAQRVCSFKDTEGRGGAIPPGCVTGHHDEYLRLANVTWGFDASSHFIIGGVWAHIVTADGQQGWILFAVSTSQL
jgi:hypothetical protein